jgi:hypothetical protein
MLIPMIFIQDLFSLLNFAKPSVKEVAEDGSIITALDTDEFGKTSIDYAT